MKIENSFEVPVPVSEAWALLMSIEDVVGCLPGAELDEVIDESTYKGTFAVRIGPISVTLGGTMQFEQRDDARHIGRLKGQASDPRGRGGAVSHITFRLEPVSDRTRIDIETDVQLSGALAQYGRGAGMISNLAGRIIDRFAECLRARIVQARAHRPEDSDALSSADGAPPVDLGRMGLEVMVDSVKSRLGRRFGGARESTGDGDMHKDPKND